MNGNEYIILRFMLDDTPAPVWRDVAIQSIATIFDLKKIVEQLFLLDPESASEFDVDGSLIDSENAQNITLQSLVETSSAGILYSSFGVDTWQVAISFVDSLEEVAVDFPVVCIAGEGQGIFNSEITHDIYNEIIESALLGETDFSAITTLDLEFLSDDIFDIDVKEINQQIQDMYVYRDNYEDDYIDDTHHHEHEHNHNHHHEHNHNHHHVTEKNVTVDDKVNSDVPEGLTDEFFMQETTVDFYVNIIGLTEEQASYHVLYESAINNIIDLMQLSGYDEAAIEATLKGTRVLEEDMYDQVKNDLELLHLLPPREELFTIADEERLVEVEQILFETLEKYEVSVDSFLELEEADMDKMEEEFMSAIQAFDNQRIS